MQNNLILGASGNSFVQESYFTYEAGGSGGETMAFGVAADTSGNVYSTAYSSVPLYGNTMKGNYDLIITKYNSTGTLVWSVEDGDPSAWIYPAAIAVDISGNVYVTGSIGGWFDGQTLTGNRDMFITKYNSSGVRQWTIQDCSAAGYCYATGLAVDASGNVYVTGHVDVAIDGQTKHGSTDFFITKYNTSGVRQWTVQDGTASGDIEADAITIDASGNSFVTGFTNKALDGQAKHGTYDFFLTEYNSSGVRQWTIQDGVASGKTYGNGVAMDSSGYLYVTGYTTKAIDAQTQHGSDDLFITKYNSSGARQWTIQDGVSGGDTEGNGITIDASNNLYVTGSTTAAIDGQTLTGYPDVFITKYNSSGTRQWTAEDGDVGGGTFGYAIAVDSTTGLTVVGQTSGAGLDGQADQGDYDLFMMKYNISGVQSP